MMTLTRFDAIHRLLELPLRMNTLHIQVGVAFHLFGISTSDPARLSSLTQVLYVLGRPPIRSAHINPRRFILHLRRNTFLPDLHSIEPTIFVTHPLSYPDRHSHTLPHHHGPRRRRPPLLLLPLQKDPILTPPTPQVLRQMPRRFILQPGLPARGLERAQERLPPARGAEIAIAGRSTQRRDRQAQQADARPARRRDHAPGLRPHQRRQEPPHDHEPRAVRGPHVAGVVRQAVPGASGDGAHGGGCGEEPGV